MKRLFGILSLILVIGYGTVLWADSYTTNYRLTKPSRGSANWDTKINTNMDTIDGLLLQALNGETYSTVLRPESHGTPGDGASDDTTIVQAAIDSCDNDTGCKIVLSCRNWKFNVEIDKPNVWIDSECGAQHNSWWEVYKISPYDADSPVITVSPVDYDNGTTVLSKPNTGFQLTNVLLHGGTSGKYGLHVVSCEYCNFDNFQIEGFSRYSLKIGDSGNAADEWNMSNQWSNFNISVDYNTGAGITTDAIVFEKGGAYITNQNFVNGIVNGPYGDNDGYCVRNGFDATWTNVYFQVDAGKGLYKDGDHPNGCYDLVNCTVEGPYNSETEVHDYSIIHNTYSNSVYHALRFTNSHFLGYFEGKDGLRINLNEVNSLQYTPKAYDMRHGGVLRFMYGIDANETDQGSPDNSTWIRRTLTTDGPYGSLLQLYGANGILAESPVPYSSSAAALYGKNTNSGYALSGYSANVPILSWLYQGAGTYNDMVWPTVRLFRSSGSAVLDGFGTGIDVQLQTADASIESAGQLIWWWDNATSKSSTVRISNREDNYSVSHFWLTKDGLNSIRYPDPGWAEHNSAANRNTIAYHIAKISTDAGTIELRGNNDYVLSDNLSVPANVQMVFQNEAMLKPSSGKVVTFDNPGQIKAGRYQIFTGDGTVVFTNPGEIYHEWFGSTGAALVKAYTASADGSVITTELESISMSAGVDVTTKTVSFQGLPNYGTTITSTGAYAFRYSKKTSGNHENFYVKDFRLDGDDTGVDGIIIQEAANGVIERVRAQEFTNAAFSVDGIGYGVEVGGYVVGVTFRNCIGADSNYGYLIDKKGNNVAFQVISLDSSWAYGNAYGVYATGGWKADSFLFRMENAEIESNTTRGVTLLNGAKLECNTCYLEQTDVDGYINYYCDNGTSAKFTNSNAAVMPGDANSTTTYTEYINSYLNVWSGFDPGPHKLGGYAQNSDCLGSPYWHHNLNAYESCTRGPTSGSRVAKGQRWMDGHGNTWIATEDGTSDGPGWKHEGEKVIISIPYTAVNGHSTYQYAAWCAEVPTLIHEVEFVVTEDFDSNGTNVRFGVGNHATEQEVWISKADTSGALTEGSVFRGSQNSSATAWLTDDNGTTPKSKYLTGHTLADIYGFLQGTGWDSNVDSCFVVYPSHDEEGLPVFTAGQGYLIIRATPLLTP